MTTSEISLFDHLVNIYSNTYVINFKNAPGNASQIEYFQSRKNPAGDYLNWRQEFLPPRILISIQNGLEKAIELQCEFAFHLHSDTYWKTEKIKNLIKEISVLQKRLFIGDLSFPNEYSAKLNKSIQPKIHFQPEGLFFNLSLSKQTDFLNFKSIWVDNNFKSHNFGSIEALIGQFAIYCLSNKKLNILDYNSKIPYKYSKYIKIRTCRTYHGEFKSGLINLNLSQEKIHSFNDDDLEIKKPSIFKRFKNKLIYLFLGCEL